MSLVTRTAILQTRVCPEIKFASEHVLRRIGLNLTEAMELFLRRIIVDEKLPFEVIALNDARLMQITEAYEIKIGAEKALKTSQPSKGHRKTRIKRE